MNKSFWHVARACLASLSSLVVLCGFGTVACSPGPSQLQEDSTRLPTTQPPTTALEKEFSAIADALESSDAAYFGNATFQRLLETEKRQDLAPGQQLEVLLQLAFHQLQRGDLDRAFELLAEAETLLVDNGRDPRGSVRFVRLQAMAQLRRAEAENCLLRRQKEACIFPLQGDGVHQDPAPAKAARQAYFDYLKLNPKDGTAVWLINVLSMAVGDYPEGVPEYFRIPAGAFESTDDIGRFEDIAPRLAVDTLNNCGGVITDDFDGDGLIDIVTSSWHPRESLHFYRNGGDGSFADRSEVSQLDQQWGGLNLISADYDNDDDLDLLVLRGAWMFEHGQIRNSLLRNDGNGTFTDVTHAAGLADPPRPTQAATWGDFDNDGDLDLYVVNERRTDGTQDNFPAQYFRNRGDGTFEDIAEDVGLLNAAHGKGVTSGDFDNDGDLDIYVSNIGPNRLFRNAGDGTFVDVADELGVQEPTGRSFASWFFDVDNDGWLDLFVAAYQASVEDVAADYMGVTPHRALTPRLYRNLGGSNIGGSNIGGSNAENSTFEDVTAAMGLEHVYLPMGANFGDLDNDGWLDMYLSTGDPAFETLVPNVMLRNDGGRRFVDITTSSGLGHLQKGHGVAFADLDNDGDQDIYHQLGGFVPGDKYHNALFLNHGHGHRHLTVLLEGRSSNRRGVGARLHLRLRTADGLGHSSQERSIYRAVGSVSSFGGSPLRQEIGLGTAQEIVYLEVDWPTSATRQRFDGPPLDATLRIIEGESTFEILDPVRFDLGAAANGGTP